ncbi:endonuclease/exonuclease/phosphatase family protein [Actinorugispora endophytica]|uniref:Endonuclease/exonuclease/phosphatase family metal-dependent hydrolase n=1 Tax=Actinorugispora endophytica TaxID=1605990 RepID=A0A4R6UYE3_9ACTN|nr:endonuclease/exonuclease/phosphatase family protein [Actinorugispora endophytica]TDQ52514.1 endonuclease/exonuclease/phosphatase family metal-dependent hydrolase [Actinorugispora endophytica]
MPVLRVLSYNVRSLRDDPAAVARVVRACRPDVLCLQEAPRLLLWRTRRRRLARRCGLRTAVSRRAGGLAILVRPGIGVGRRAHRRLSRRRGLHPRALSVAVLAVDGHQLTAAVSHLDLEPGARLEHAAEILALLSVYDAPVVLAADVNEEPVGPAWRLLAARLPDTGGTGPTFPARRPRKRIDGIFADPRLGVLASGVPRAPLPADLASATDHHPVLAEIALR